MSAGAAAEIRANLARARESLSAARLLLEGGHPDFAASRSYYAAFYAACAVLLSKGLQYRKHGQTIGAIHKNLVRTGELDPRLGRSLNWLFELRALGDYGETRHVLPAEAQRALDSASELVAALERLCDDA
ncbi:MAG: HEPN domain-containing protein [Nitrospiraceae bacterium]|nr:HEPN domain-containing protein [Nitrospiraceae bacterium]